MISFNMLTAVAFTFLLAGMVLGIALSAFLVVTKRGNEELAKPEESLFQMYPHIDKRV